MADLTVDDLKLVLSVDPDEEALQKALNQINAELERAKVEKIKINLKESLTELFPKDALPVSYWESRFGNVGKALESEFDKATEELKRLRVGMDPEVLSKRFSDDALIAEERKKLSQLEKEERIKQSGGRWGQLKRKMRGEEEENKGPSALGLAGGMAGEALGGSVGGAAGQIVGEVVEKILKAIETVAKAVVGLLSSVADGLREVQGTLGPLGAGLGAASDAFSAIGTSVKMIPHVGDVLGPLFDTVGKIPGIFKSLMETGVSLVEKVSPGIVKQLNDAIEDASATIGQAFLPVVQDMIPLIRDLGTTIAQALPSDAEMRQIFGQVFAGIKDMVKDLVPLIGPAMRALTIAMRVIVEVVHELTKGFTNFAASTGLIDLTKPSGAGEDREAISAARTAHIGGIEEYQRSLQLETFRGGRETKTDPMVQISGSVVNIHSLVKDISGGIALLIDLVKLIADVVAAPKIVVDSARDLIVASEQSSKTEKNVREEQKQGRLQQLNPNRGWSTWDLWK